MPGSVPAAGHTADAVDHEGSADIAGISAPPPHRTHAIRSPASSRASSFSSRGTKEC